MAKSIDATIMQLGRTVRRRGAIEFSTIELRDSNGQQVIWTRMGMDRELAERLHIGEAGRFYFSAALGTLYGVRLRGEKGLFRSSAANPLMLIMSVGMVFLGLATSAFLFPFLLALAGLAGMLLCLDARRARSRFRGDEQAASASPSALPAHDPPAKIRAVHFSPAYGEAHLPFVTPSQIVDKLEAMAREFDHPTFAQNRRFTIREAAEGCVLLGLAVRGLHAFVRAPGSGQLFSIPESYWGLRRAEPPWRISDQLDDCPTAPGQDRSIIGQPVLISGPGAEELIARTSLRALLEGIAL